MLRRGPFLLTYGSIQQQEAMKTFFFRSVAILTVVSVMPGPDSLKMTSKTSLAEKRSEVLVPSRVVDLISLSFGYDRVRA